MVSRSHGRSQYTLGGLFLAFSAAIPSQIIQVFPTLVFSDYTFGMAMSVTSFTCMTGFSVIGILSKKIKSNNITHMYKVCFQGIQYQKVSLRPMAYYDFHSNFY